MEKEREKETEEEEEREILIPYELEFSDLLLLSSDEPSSSSLAPDEIERLGLMTRTIMENLGPTGPGLIAITGVPIASTLRRTLLPLARELALLNFEDRKRVLKDISPLTSGRLSHSSGPLNATLPEETPDDQQLSPSEEYDDVLKFSGADNTLQPLFATNHNVYGTGCSNTPGSKTVGRVEGEKREEERRYKISYAQIHAAVSVAGVAAAVAAIAAATSSSRNDEQMVKTEMAVASAATLVAAQCVEAVESVGAERDHLISAVNSAVNVRSHGDILTLTAAAATALRGAATLKARALKEVWNIAAVIPIDKGLEMGVGQSDFYGHTNGGYCEELFPEENFLGTCNQELLARGTELLKRTCNGDLHWKVVSVYIHRTGQVMLKMKSKHVASTITKKKKNVVLEVCKNMPAWPGGHLLENGEQHRYFGPRTTIRGVVEFECKNKRDYDMWTKSILRLLSIASETKNGRKNEPKQLSCATRM